MDANAIIQQLPYCPNPQQEQVIEALARFCEPGTRSDSVFILNGYAGTGKTSLTGALVRYLTSLNIPVVLLAPTGRAAKVFAQNAGMPAYTIHRFIYQASLDPAEAGSHFVRENKGVNAMFIVDEASMIPDAQVDAQGEPITSLLDDLLQFVFTGTNCKLLLLGDVAQLPPVGSDRSPALNVEGMRKRGLHVTAAQMTSVVRQSEGSLILRNATWQRKVMLLNDLPHPKIGFGKDVMSLQGADLPDLISRFYRDGEMDDTIIITRSNRRATGFNQGVRTEVIGCEQELRVEERLIVVKNNYMWSAKNKIPDFIANGDMGQVLEIYGYEEKHGFRFADVSLRLTASGRELDCKILLDTLLGNTPSLEQDPLQALLYNRMEEIQRMAPDQTQSQWLKTLRQDEYFNALQVKYAYAVTCHKAQGGQWKNVIVDMGGIDLDSPTIDFYRWLYTATTRATSKLYFLNLGDED